MAKISIHSLPEELLSIIVSELLRTSVVRDQRYALLKQGGLNFRLASRPCSRIAVPIMARLYFEKRVIMASKESIASLLRISQHPVSGINNTTAPITAISLVKPN